MIDPICISRHLHRHVEASAAALCSAPHTVARDLLVCRNNCRLVGQRPSKCRCTDSVHKAIASRSRVHNNGHMTT